MAQGIRTGFFLICPQSQMGRRAVTQPSAIKSDSLKPFFCGVEDTQRTDGFYQTAPNVPNVIDEEIKSARQCYQLEPLDYIEAYRKYRWQTRVVTLPAPDGLSVRLRRYNPCDNRSGPAILFITGYGDNPEGGDPFVEAGIESPYPVYSLDRTYRPEHPASFEMDRILSEAEIALNYLYKQTGQLVVLMGFSLGGNLAARLAVRCPEKIQKLALMSPTVLQPEQIETVHQIMEQLMPGDPVLNILNKINEQISDSLPDVFRNIRVPVRVYKGQQETEVPGNREYIEYLSGLIPLTGNQKVFNLMEGPHEKHPVTMSRLRALTQWLSE